MRLTLACPVALRDDANQLARALGDTPEDDRTFVHAFNVDAEGRAYCVPRWRTALPGLRR